MIDFIRENYDYVATGTLSISLVEVVHISDATEIYKATLQFIVTAASVYIMYIQYKDKKNGKADNDNTADKTAD